MSTVHIIGVAGKATSALAVEFKKLGWKVTGSDQGMYPPVSDILNAHKISVKTPYDEKHISKNIDLVVVGGNALLLDQTNPEVEKAKELNLPIKSYPEVLQEFLIKNTSVVVAGNYGKGTVSGGIVKALLDNGEDLSYMVGGKMEDIDDNMAITEGKLSVIEGDEYPTPNIDGTSKSKFFYYKPTHLLITSAAWDHVDAFPTHKKYIDNFVELVKLVPKKGIIVANADGDHVKEIVKHAKCPVKFYSINSKADYTFSDLKLETPLVGNFNQSNATGIYAMLKELKLSEKKIREAIVSYHGLHQRMNVVFESEEYTLVRDYAHSPVKADAVLNAVKEQWPGREVVGILDIHASSLKNKKVLDQLKTSCSAADSLFIPKVTLVRRIKREDQVTGKEIEATLRTSCPQTYYVPGKQQLSKAILSSHVPAVIVIMSSGDMSDLESELLEAFTYSQAILTLKMILYQYINFEIQGKRVRIPYYINTRRWNLFKTAGKGTIDEIQTELERIAKRKKVDLKETSEGEIYKLMRDNSIGIDCSGLAYYMLDGLVARLYSKRLSQVIKRFPGPLGLLERWVFRYKRVRRINVRTLVAPWNAHEITNLNDIRPGDLISASFAKKHDHVLIVTDVDYNEHGIIQTILYAHSSMKDTSQTGPHTSEIRVVNIEQSLTDQQWMERTRSGEKYNVYFKPDHDRVYRLNILKK